MKHNTSIAILNELDELLNRTDQESKTAWDTIRESANRKFTDNTKTTLTEEAIQEATRNNLDTDVYKNLLLSLGDTQNSTLQSSIKIDYNNLTITPEKLLKDRNLDVNTLASFYPEYKAKMDIYPLMLSNLGRNQGIENEKSKTTFVHALFENNASKEDIMHFFSKLSNLASETPILVENYLSLSDINGESITDVLEKMSSHPSYKDILREIKTKYGALYPLDKSLATNDDGIYNFVSDDENGYVLALEDLYTKDKAMFRDKLAEHLRGGISKKNIGLTESSKLNIMMGLLLSSRNNEMIEEVKEVFLQHVKNFPQKAKNQYLIEMVRSSNTSVLNLLIQSGADANAITEDSRDTALIVAAMYNNITAMELLLKNGAKIEARNYYGETALHYAAVANSLEATILLLKIKPEIIDARSNNGNTPLMFAAQQGNLKLIPILIDNGANPNAADRNGITALNIAAQEGMLGVIPLLLDNGAKINIENPNGVIERSLNVLTGGKEYSIADKITNMSTIVKAIPENKMHLFEEEIRDYYAKEIVNNIKSDAGFIWDDEKLWEKVGKIVNSLRAEDRVEVIKKSVDGIQSVNGVDTFSRIDRLISCLKEEEQELVRGSIKSTVPEASTNNRLNTFDKYSSSNKSSFSDLVKPKKREQKYGFTNISRFTDEKKNSSRGDEDGLLSKFKKRKKESEFTDILPSTDEESHAKKVKTRDERNQSGRNGNGI